MRSIKSVFTKTWPELHLRENRKWHDNSAIIQLTPSPAKPLFAVDSRLADVEVLPGKAAADRTPKRRRLPLSPALAPPAPAL
jgi:hypothetical protein